MRSGPRNLKNPARLNSSGLNQGTGSESPMTRLCWRSPHGDKLPIRKGSHHTGAPSDLFIEAFQHARRQMLFRSKTARLRLPRFSAPGRSGDSSRRRRTGDRPSRRPGGILHSRRARKTPTSSQRPGFWMACYRKHRWLRGGATPDPCEMDPATPKIRNRRYRCCGRAQHPIAAKRGSKRERRPFRSAVASIAKISGCGGRI